MSSTDTAVPVQTNEHHDTATNEACVGAIDDGRACFICGSTFGAMEPYQTGRTAGRLWTWFAHPECADRFDREQNAPVELGGMTDRVTPIGQGHPGGVDVHRYQRVAREAERSIAADFIEEISRLRQFVEVADDLTPFQDRIVRDDLETIMAVLYGGEVPT
jgi:hypothetical protein